MRPGLLVGADGIMVLCWLESCDGCTCSTPVAPRICRNLGTDSSPTVLLWPSFNSGNGPAGCREAAQQKGDYAASVPPRSDGSEGGGRKGLVGKVGTTLCLPPDLSACHTKLN